MINNDLKSGNKHVHLHSLPVILADDLIDQIQEYHKCYPTIFTSQQEDPRKTM